MSYNPNIPATGHSASQDYTQIQGNFAEIQNAFSVNHQPLASGSTDGYHSQIQFANVQVSDPNKTAPVASLYTKTVAGNPQLFFQNGSLSADVSQLTGNNSIVGNGYTTLPGGALLQWASASGSSVLTINFPITFPNNVFSVSISTTGGAIASGITSLTTSSVSVGFASVGTPTVYVIAIGN